MLVMRGIFSICGNESQPGLQILEKLATLMLCFQTSYSACPVKDAIYVLFLCFKRFEFEYETNKCGGIFFFFQKRRKIFVFKNFRISMWTRP